MKRKMLALLLSAAMVLSLLGATALAVEGDESASSSASVSEPLEGEGETAEPAPAEDAEPEESTDPAEDADPEEGTDPTEDAGPEESTDPGEGEPPAPKDGGEDAGDSSSEPLDGPAVTVGALTAENVPQDGTAPEAEPDPYVPDPAGTITFDNLGRRMRENNLNVLALEENIQVIQSTDYDELKEDLRKGLNEIASTQWNLISIGSGINTGMPGLDGALSGLASLSTASTVQQLQVQYDAMRETFDDIKDGKLQADHQDLVRQLENAQNQVILAGETLYIALVNMEQSSKAIDRGLNTLDRTLKELELRYELGHIPAQTLAQTQGARDALLSNQRTLNSNIEAYTLQLEMHIGAQLTGKARLGGLPQVTAEQLQSMDLERDVAAAKQASYSLYEAKQTLDQAKEDFDDAGSKYNHSEKHYEYIQAQHQWQASQHTYNAAVQSFEMSLRVLYLKVKDNDQVLTAARNALALERNNFAAVQLKHSQGNLSESAVAEAEDKVKQAQEAVDSALIELFASYRSYRWAVDYGILNT